MLINKPIDVTEKIPAIVAPSTKTLFGSEEQCYIIDAKKFGNIARYLNQRRSRRWRRGSKPKKFEEVMKRFNTAMSNILPSVVGSSDREEAQTPEVVHRKEGQGQDDGAPQQA